VIFDLLSSDFIFTCPHLYMPAREDNRA